MGKSVKVTLDLSVNGVPNLISAKVSVDDLNKTIKKAAGETHGLGKAMKTLGEVSVPLNATIQCFQSLQTSLSSLTEENGRFAASMRAANTMAGKSGADFERLKDQVSELSKTVPVARDELADGLYQVVSNGVPEDNWLSFLEASARSSVGGMADLGETVKVTSTVIKNYGMSWEEAAAVQDKIQLTAKNGVTSFKELADALPRVTGNAATLGVSMDELMASFSTLTGVSGNTAEVSTQLAAIFTALVKPSSEATKMAAEMGIQFDAAAIKAAGGMQAFLTQLDAAVKSYSQSSGVLEQEVYGKLFGSAESLRAIGPLTGQLASTFATNVEAMKGSAGTMDEAFDTMSQGVSSKTQLMENSFGAFMDRFAGIINAITPALNLASTVGIVAMSFTSMGNAVKVCGGAMLAFSRNIGLAAVAQKAWNFVVAGTKRAFTSLTLGASMYATSLGLATTATRVLTWAIRGMMIASGIGIAIGVVSIAVELFGNKSEEAAGKVDQLTEAEQRQQQQAEQLKQVRDDAAAAMELEKAKLKNLIDTHADATAEVNRLNNQYGEIFGTYKTAADWYDTLVAKSKDYCDQLVLEELIKRDASKVAQYRADLEDLQRQYDLSLTVNPAMANRDARTGRPRAETGVGAGVYLPGKGGQPRFETPASYLIKTAMEGARRVLKDAETTMQSHMREYQAKAASMKSTPTPATRPPGGSSKSGGGSRTGSKPAKGGGSTTTPKPDTANEAPTPEEAINAALQAEDRKLQQLWASLAAAQNKLAEYSAKIDAGELDLNDDAVASEYQERYDAAEAAASGFEEESEAIRGRITQLRARQQELADLRADLQTPVSLDTFADIDANMQLVQESMNRASGDELKALARRLEELKKLRSEMEKQLRPLPKTAAEVSTSGDIDAQISLYSEMQQDADAQGVWEFQKRIEELNKKKYTVEVGMRLPEMQRTLDELAGLDGKQLTVKLQAIGLDEMQAKIKDIEKILANPGSLSPDLLKELQRQLALWKKYHKDVEQTDTVLKNMEGMSSAAGAIDRLGQSFKNLSSESKGLQAAIAGVSLAASLAQMVADMVKLAGTKSVTVWDWIAGIAAGTATIVASAMAFKSIGVFAEGGVVSGPTLALMGEYAGASNNPEVIAPLNKLWSMLDTGDGGFGGKKDVTFKIKGRNLEGVLHRERRVRQRR